MEEERFLLFQAAGEGFAFRLREISEVMEPQDSFPCPRAPRHFLGLLNFHGTLTALVDLSRYLGRESRSREGKVLVLDTRGAHLALLVEGVWAILPREAVLDQAPGDDPLTAAVLQTEQGEFRLLTLETLVFALEQGL
ncbi:chemotaxis protein CheW [Geomonas sp.]|uniref:chemotaxis protein CheW n=1 Tax=Geomonas sp. TaxID=2651584 RepID=UPI002B46A797|nr:chemotaxis protein CheW [Geomonas sp.]HJV35059.1 chemotaxis protein CheW [Geomonas sp.]